MFTFAPRCKGNVASDVKTGQIDHRNGVWEQVFCQGQRCEGKSVCLRVLRV